MTSPQAASARAFHQLHEGGILLLANAWDAGSARLIESRGAKAVATTSAGLAWAHGYADGDRLPVRLLAASVSEIVRAIRIPLSVDMEGGYSDQPAAVGEAVGTIVDAGGVGINIEDGSAAPDLLCAKIEQAKEAGVRRGVDIFVNARTDVYLRELVPAGRRVEETLARAEQYRAAGSDGIFVPGLAKPDEIRAIAAAIPLPLNVLARPGLLRRGALAEMGVRRLSAGSAIAQVIYARIAAMTSAFLQDGNSDLVSEGSMPYSEINALME